MIKAIAIAIAMLAMAALWAPRARADDAGERAVVHGPLQPEVQDRVRMFLLNLAANFGGFYPEADYRHVRAVYFSSGAIIVCGELNRQNDVGGRIGWRYFSNSGPLIFESDGLETLCDARTYGQPGFADDHEYAPDFIKAATR